ncbi:IPT/TIG domain-containing protein [Arcicella aurantiaca]|nr:IPT/TIG domain-containing protein [Arcicella aurantiaca]
MKSFLSPISVLIIGLIFFGYYSSSAQSPTITSFSPESGCPSTVINITGTNLTDVTDVKIGSTNVTSFNIGTIYYLSQTPKSPNFALNQLFV